MYHLTITDQPKRRHVKFGTTEKIVCKKKTYSSRKELYADYRSFYDAFSDLEKVIIKIDEWPRSKKPKRYPNIIRIDFLCYGIDKKVEEILISEKVSFEVKPIEIINDRNVAYKAVYFPEMPLLDLKASNVNLNENGWAITKGKNYYTSTHSPMIFTDKLENIKGIQRIKELPNTLVCDENIKKSFEKNKLLGIELAEIYSFQEFKYFYWSVATAYIGEIENGDHIQANNQYKIIQYLHKKFMCSEEGKQEMKTLLRHWRPPVRLLSATQLLPVYPEESIKVLKELAINNNIVGITARTTLDEWKKGNLKTDWLHSLLAKFSNQVTFKSITKTKSEIKN